MLLQRSSVTHDRRGQLVQKHQSISSTTRIAGRLYYYVNEYGVFTHDAPYIGDNNIRNESRIDVWKKLIRCLEF